MLFPYSLRLSVAIAAAVSASVGAQAVEIPAQDEIEEIVVIGRYTVSETIDTATGLGLSIAETPQSVSILTELRIRDQALNTIVEAVDHTVGVSSSAVDNVRNTLAARGFEISNYQIDSVPLSWSLAGDSGETIADLSIYERVEFVRGSTGLLTGVGDPSASINLVRKKAGSTELSGYVAAARGSWDTTVLSADVANGFNEQGSVRGRLVAKIQDGDGYTDLYSNKVGVLYGVMEVDLSKDTLLRFGSSYQNNKPQAPVWGGLPGTFSDGSPTDWDVSQTTAADWTRWETTGVNVFANVEHHFRNDWSLHLNYNKLRYTKDTKLLYLYGDLNKETGEGLITWPYKSEGESEQDSIDIQLKGSYGLFSREHELVIGALYSEQSAVSEQFSALTNSFLPAGNFYEWSGNFPQPDWAATPTIAEDMETKQEGLYAATRLHVSDNLKLIAGGRLSSWERTGISYDIETDFGESGVFVPYAGALYDVTNNHRFYVSYAEIFKPQNAQDRYGEYLDPLEGATVEAGFKSQFLGDQLQTSFAVFRIEQENLGQNLPPENGQPVYVPRKNPPTLAQFETEGVVSDGFEIEVIGSPLDGWHISSGYSQFKAEDAADTPVNPNHPRKQFTLFTTYNFVDLLPELTVGGGLRWQDDISLGGSSQNSYAVVNLMARYDVTSQLDVQLNIANVDDEKYYNYIAGNGQVRFGAPRNAALALRYHF